MDWIVLSVLSVVRGDVLLCSVFLPLFSFPLPLGRETTPLFVCLFVVLSAFDTVSGFLFIYLFPSVHSIPSPCRGCIAPVSVCLILLCFFRP